MNEPARRTDPRRPTSAAKAEQAMLDRIMTLIAGGASWRLVLDSIVHAIEAEHPGLLCSILLLDESGERLTHGAAPSLPEAYIAALDGERIGPGVGSCGSAAFLRERVIVADIQTDPLWRDYRHLAASAGLASCWSEPIFGGGDHLLGTFAMYHRNISEPDEADIAAIQNAARLAAIAIDRKHALDALAASEARAERAAAGEMASAMDLQTFFDVSQDLLCVTDSRGVLVKVNRSWERMLGYPKEQLLGAFFLRLVHPKDVPSVWAARERLEAGDRAHSFITRCRCADGSYRSIEWRVGPAGDRFHSVGRDVTERIRAEAELRAAKAEAEAANRAKSDFLANMSHEVRTPLNGVIGVVDALAQTELTPVQREMVDLIQGSGTMLERLVSDILDISKIEAGRLELELRTFDLQAALGSVLEVARIRADEKGVAFRVDYGEGARGLFLGDSVRLKQILGNLLSNAVKFTASGEVRARIDVIEAEPGVADAPARLMIVVRDTGVGFDPLAAAALFERFSQADSTITRRFGGTGLGLAIIKALVDMMRGEIHATSRPGEGAVFTLSLPLPRSQPLTAFDRAAAEAPAPTRPVAADLQADRPLRILLAEDNATNQKVVELILAPFGVDLTIVGGGAEAVTAFESGRFDLVLMDMQMPGMDGLAATRALRAIERGHPDRRRTAVAMLSANAMEHHCDAAVDAGADLHIAKPVTARALIDGVRQALSVNGAIETEAGLVVATA